MQIDLTNIKNIIFDMGNVLLNLDFEASIKAFQELGLAKDILDRKLVYSDPVFYDLETGNVTTEKFRNRLREILKNPTVTDQQIDEAWNAMILDIPAKRVTLLLELSKKYNVYLFSNTNKIHINKISKEFLLQHAIDFSSLFVKDYYSQDIKDRKPNLSSFEKVVKLSGINPEESLFVDDLEDNINGAQQVGLKTFWLKSGMELVEVF
ncbi:MAG: HAD family phosphatase [Bacteroidetes bacterium]|nr:HAD family phosphatase [Bacteroidota bacterium]